MCYCTPIHIKGKNAREEYFVLDAIFHIRMGQLYIDYIFKVKYIEIFLKYKKLMEWLSTEKKKGSGDNTEILDASECTFL